MITRISIKGFQIVFYGLGCLALPLYPQASSGQSGSAVETTLQNFDTPVQNARIQLGATLANRTNAVVGAGYDFGNEYFQVGMMAEAALAVRESETGTLDRLVFGLPFTAHPSEKFRMVAAPGLQSRPGKISLNMRLGMGYELARISGLTFGPAIHADIIPDKSTELSGGLSISTRFSHVPGSE